MYSFRLTTNGMLHTYRANLQSSYRTLATASERVQTGRNFLSYADDPAAATQAFQLRREHWQTSAQSRNNDTVLKSFQQAWSSFDLVKNDLASETAHVNSLRGLNDPDGTARKTLGQSTKEVADSAIQTMNVKYGEKFLFAGADGKNAPFSWEDVAVKDEFGNVKLDEAGNEITSRQLCFRGIAVDQPETWKDPDGGEDIPNEDYQKLQDMMNEATYVDIGLGMQENPDGTPIKSTVYNSALSGLEFLDFGLDEDGDPKNAVSLMNKIGDLLLQASDMDGQWVKVEGENGAGETWTNNSEAYEELFRLTGKLEKAMDKMDVEYTELDTKASFLQNNDLRLTGQIKELNEQVLEIEEVDPVEAITALSWAQYCYNAGLKIGNSILSQSLIDYMS